MRGRVDGILVGALLCVSALGCTPESSPVSNSSAGDVAPSGVNARGYSNETAPLPAVRDAPLPSRVMRGVCLAHSYQSGGTAGYGSEASARTLDELRALGVRWVSLTPFGFMSGLESDAVRPLFDHVGGETDARIRAEIRAAHARGMSVQLKPHIWIRGGAWRARIDPGGAEAWTRWFASYRAWFLHYAHLAALERVEALVVGVELGSSVTQQPERWRALIREVRRVFPGRLLYAANWDAVSSVPFWDALDAIGVQFYAPLTDRADASLAALTERAGRALDAYAELSRSVDRPVVLTEVGYRSSSDAALRPHAWPEHDQAPSVDEAAQAQAYRALFRAVAARPFVHGVFVWKWFTDPSTREEGPTGFSPRGKTAEAVLRSVYSSPPSARSSSESTTRREVSGESASETSARPRRGASVDR